MQKYGKKGFQIARDQRTKKPIHIGQLDLSRKGLNSRCYCDSCKETLVASIDNPETRKVAKHFKHKKDSHCTGGNQMTLLHELCQAIVAELDKLYISQGELYTPEKKGIVEKDFKGFRVDVFFEGKDSWIVEIKKSHAVEDDTLNKMKERNFNVLEIDVNSLDPSDSYVNLKDQLANNLQIREVLNRCVENTSELAKTHVKHKKETDLTIGDALIGAGLFVGVIYLIKKVFKSNF